MRKALMLASAGLIGLAGCSPASDKAEDYTAEAAPAADAAAEAPADATAPDAAAPAQAVAPRPAPLAPVAQIAYAYS